eukprot:6543286-Prymnesium_polylepis.1
MDAMCRPVDTSARVLSPVSRVCAARGAPSMSVSVTRLPERGVSGRVRRRAVASAPLDECPAVI